ncbi:HD-GYP domain-containing protein [Peribacillus saganii]|uniref:HD-GYP domain-containing protein n=1 Tax=Peribacillus saganii TaxID=2303992 RepID=A0A372LPQ3_9BACI|nr:HD-GYP domain-containing protein [Peribacillus saganii]RFU70099.1 HD-GYP domain-containing protein [Peribacillus saganii]
MRLINTDTLIPGLKLGRSLYNENGQILLKDGVELTERMIQRLMELNIPFVYIQERRTEHIKPARAISEDLQREAIKTIVDTFAHIQKEDKNASIVIEKAAKQINELIRHILKEIHGNKELLSLLADVFIHDNYIFTHSLNVTLYSLAIGIEMKLNQKQIETLGMGAILHDVGKMLVPAKILMKPDKLTAEEFAEMKKHSELGFQLLRNAVTVPLVVAHCAYQHHERLDGTGYPRGIKGEDIHLFGRIIAVADVFDAVTSNRVYRKAMLPHEGLEILYAGSATQFEVHIVEAFRRAVAIYPVGLMVELSDGRIGVVSKQNPGLSDRPVIEILEENAQAVEPYEVNLKDRFDLLIVSCDTAISVAAITG